MLAVGLGCDRNFRSSGRGGFIVELENVVGTKENQDSHSAMFILWLGGELVLSSGVAAVRDAEVHCSI